MPVETLTAIGAAVVALIPVYVYLFRMNRVLGEVRATTRHNAEHLERLNDDVDENRERLNQTI